MQSQVDGFEYDVFVSYRHNDNKTLDAHQGSGWVSEFVASLRLELETTIKGKVGIYVDENPHDGLLETQNVDGSLAPKLRAVIFIPILSQTYCDPGSFAWRNEFLSFCKMSATDRLGLSVKLINGNAANRVLPIRIHELDAADTRLIEDQLKTKLRPVDFILKSPGVNRPLQVVEEDLHKNANRTDYRDQINKVANAIRDIIYAVRANDKPAPAKLRPSLSNPAAYKPSIKSIAVSQFIAKTPMINTSAWGSQKI